MIKLIFGLLLAIFIFSCEDNGNPDQTNDIEIIIGTVCGWCGGIDSLTVTNDMLKYEYYNYCTDNSITKLSPTDKNEFSQLIIDRDIIFIRGDITVIIKQKIQFVRSGKPMFT